jgi:hypothetical protein
MLKNTFCFFILIFSYLVPFAQQDAWVFFTNKENVETSIANPLTILTQRAIDRKERHNVQIDERDVPVNETYISQIKIATGITVFAKSKWFNAIHVRGSEDDINSLLDETFVDHIEFADRSLNGSRNAEAYQNKFEIEDVTEDFDYGNTFNQVDMIKVNTLHEANYTGEGMLVAVLDAGFPNVDTMGAFQRLRDNGDLLGGYDFVDREDNVFLFAGSTHGTKVLSTMAGFIQDEFVGTAPDASFMLFRTEDVTSENPVEESYWVEAAERADSLGVDVINTSLGYKGYDNANYSYTSDDINGITAYITRGANMAAEKGILLVNSAGNSGASGILAPSDAAGIFTTAAVDADGNYASFSSQGSAIQPTQKPDVATKGLGSAVIGPDNVIVSNNGTSFSSPILAGAITSLWQAVPNRTNQEIMQYVRESASQFDMPDFFLGYGIPNFEDALATALSVEEQEHQDFEIFPNPVIHNLEIIFPFETEQAEIRVFDILGKLIFKSPILEVNNTINFDFLASGLYMLQLESPKFKNTFKLIKR